MKSTTVIVILCSSFSVVNFGTRKYSRLHHFDHFASSFSHFKPKINRSFIFYLISAVKWKEKFSRGLRVFNRIKANRIAFTCRVSGLGGRVFEQGLAHTTYKCLKIKYSLLSVYFDADHPHFLVTLTKCDLCLKN